MKKYYLPASGSGGRPSRWGSFRLAVAKYSHRIAQPGSGLPRDEEAEVDGLGTQEIFPTSYEIYAPIFILTVSIVELGVFLYHVVDLGSNYGLAVTSSGPVPVCSVLIYNPFRRFEVWRLMSYILVHCGWIHISSNVAVQLFLGLPLEVVHGPLRVGTVYLAGALSGALLSSVTDPGAYLAGASGGVYALLLAHLPTLVLNWKQMKTLSEWAFSLLAIVIGIVDLGFSIYDRYSSTTTSVGYSAHFGGAAAGILVGMNMLRNFERERWEGYLRLVCFLVWTAGLVAGILVNAFGTTAFPYTDLSPLPGYHCRLQFPDA